MLRWLLGGGLCGLATISLVLLAAPAPAQTPTAPPTPILVELFTSEGCSSCPPADAVLANLAKTPNVIVLAHHVDYWDGLGWPDPWSSGAASARERTYGKGSYTPHAFIDGDANMVGSRGGAIESAIADASKRPHLPIAIDLIAAGKDAFDVTVRATPPPDSELAIAVVQNRGKVAVPRGENAGKTLEHVGIVRSIVTAPAGAKTRVNLPAPIAAPDGTTFSVVAFIQSRGDHHILGSAVRPCQ